jgi:hypothetical protein
MKLASLIVMISVAPFSAALAQDAFIQRLQFAQAGPSKSEHQPAGACTPIGLTANGDIVFPWECRETIEKQRGPISVSLPPPSNNAPSHQPSALPDARSEDTVATVTAAQPKAEEAAADAASPPEVNAAATHAKPRLLPKRVSGLGRSQFGPPKGQHVALQAHQGGSGVANAKKNGIAVQPVAAQK